MQRGAEQQVVAHIKVWGACFLYKLLSSRACHEEVLRTSAALVRGAYPLPEGVHKAMASTEPQLKCSASQCGRMDGVEPRFTVACPGHPARPFDQHWLLSKELSAVEKL